MTDKDALRLLQRIAIAVERLSPEQEPMPDIKQADAFVWDAERKTLIAVDDTEHVELSLLHGIEQSCDTLMANSLQFAQGYSANNALLWGARGMGKSSLVKTIHAEVNKQHPHSLALVEIHRDDIATMPQLLNMLRGWVIRRFIIFCDDLSFDLHDHQYKSLKTALEGGIEGRANHILFYATSNRRHLMARSMSENDTSTAIHPGEDIEENTSLADRFGLWLGFHSCSQDDYLTMVEKYSEHYRLKVTKEALHQHALEWAATRGTRSGRVAWQFIQHLAGELHQKIA